MSAGDVGLIITAVALLLCLRCWRAKPNDEDEEITTLFEVWRNGK